MSNITLFSAGGAVPDYLRGVTDDATKELSGGTGGKQISIKGGVWRMMVGGEEVAKNEERAMNLVVLATAKGITRTYYAEAYEEGKDTTPACWSAEGVVPDPMIAAPQSNACATCPQNIEGSGQGKSRACRFSKRLAVALEGDITGNVYRISIPAKSFFGKADGDKMPLQAFGKFLSGHSIPITGIVTEARFDTSEAVPVLKFRAVRPLTKPEWDAAKLQSLTEDARQAVDFKMVLPKAAVPALPATFAAAPAALDAPTPAEPVKRATKKPEVVAPTKDVADILENWGSDDE